MSSTGIRGAPCWFCRAPIPGERARAEAVIQPRSEEEGGPFQTVTCPRCRTLCGALRNRVGDWLFYPLEGRTEPTLIDRLVPRNTRRHLERARAWWITNAVSVERFRSSRTRAPAEPPPRERPKRRAPSRAAPPAPGGPRAVLGVPADATLADVRRAWRAAAKRWHPDRVGSADAALVAEARRRFAEIRAAYEALSAELAK